MSADEVTGSFGAGSALRTLSGVGHAEIDETTETGARQTANGDRLEVALRRLRRRKNGDQESRDRGTKGTREQEGTERGGAGSRVGSPVSESRTPPHERGPVRGDPEPGAPASVGAGATEVQSAELDGNVVLFEQPAAKTGAQVQPPLRATAGKAVYEGEGEWLHLTVSPRVVNGGMELTAEKVDVSQQSGDAFAHGNVKATWTGAAAGGTNLVGGSKAGNDGVKGGAAKNDSGGVTLGGKGPAHVVAAEAQLNQSSGEATFHGLRLSQLRRTL